MTEATLQRKRQWASRKRKATVGFNEGKRSMGHKQINEGRCCNPLTALRRKVRGPRGQPPGAIALDPREAAELIRETYGETYVDNVKEKER